MYEMSIEPYPDFEFTPPDFSIKDSDRIKVLWADIYRAEYRASRKDDLSPVKSIMTSSFAASEACKHFKQWLEVCDVVIDDPMEEES